MLLALTAWVCAIAAVPAASAQPARVGWQVPWATEGQVVSAIKHTNIRQLVGLDMTFVDFTYGAPLNRAALAGEVDVLFTADQPALTLLAKSPDFIVVARLMYNRVCLYVPPRSAITTARELSGKVVMGPSGAAAERFALAAMSRSGIDVQSVRRGNLDMGTQLAMAKSATDRARWPGADAFYGFDPIVAEMEQEGLSRNLDCGNVVAVVVASRAFAGTQDDLTKFLTAVQLSWAYFATHSDEVNAWYAADSGLDVGDKVLDACAAVEPNKRATSVNEVSLRLSDADFATFEDARQFLVSQGVIPAEYRFAPQVDQSTLEHIPRSSNT